METSIRVIALDGPAASGKSTVGERLAKELGYVYLDTGVMYRAVTLAALLKDIDIDDEAGVVRVAEEMNLNVLPPSKEDGRSNDIILEGEDVTWAIREKRVVKNVSKVSAYAGVRTAMTDQQRKIGSKGSIVMVGRDIGTVVLPNADLKIYLDASVEERARRRHLELVNRGEDVDFDFILNDLKRRDNIDSTRDVAPLKAADDAVVVDSDALNAEEVFVHIENLIKNRDIEKQQK